MDDTPQPVDPATLKYLRLLVTVLTVVTIVGLLVIIALFVIRFSSLGEERAAPSVEFPTELALPAGETASAITRGEGWIAVVTQAGRILILDNTGQHILQEIDVPATRE
ncbi:hypothetical protein KO491_14960 [Roseovarius nubinhibens]|uniref:DUF6476 family protein n=1 Tax=Roseovarius nubinhibens TaxID=314263 RepID=UPI001C082239|nr:DUF6476 family protein [Roseovarius nubinhibens]MBU3001143.1 hypothetical protein [Roseovarius nubinhibens]